MPLTKHPVGSLKELCGVSLPLVLFSFSSVLMYFLDRLFLARYSLDALNAVASASTMMWGFATGTYILASMAEIFVAQYNGGGLAHRLGQPVWQMIWFSLATSLFFWPIAYVATPALYGGTPYEKMAGDYFLLMMLSGPAWPLIASLSAFYIGQGKTKVIVCMVLLANGTNILLDWVLIFGIKGWLPAMGPKGAALSSIIGQVFQIAFLFFLFLKKENRSKHGTGDFLFRPKLFKKCFCLGLPQALLETCTISGWAVYYWIMAKAGTAYITVASITHSICLLFSFVGEGLYKGSAAIAGNLLGAKQVDQIPNVVKAGIRFHLIFFALIAFLLVCYPTLLIDQFLPLTETDELVFSFGHGTLTHAQFVEQLRICFFFILFHLFFEQLSWLFSGILSASGDTLYLFAAGSASIWTCLIGPIYFFVLVQGCEVWVGYLVMVGYSFTTCFAYAWRYTSGRWRGRNLLDLTTSKLEEDQRQLLAK